MARRRVNNPLALAVLACLQERPMHPYEISSTLRQRGKEASIKLNYGSLYSVVEALARHGLITARETSREGRRPERTVYEITEAGTAEFEDWLSELLSTPVREFSSLEAGLSLMPGLPPDDVVMLLNRRAYALGAELGATDAMQAQAADEGIPELFLVEGRFRSATLRAELDFVTDLTKRIQDGSYPGVKLWRRIHELRADGVSFEEIAADPVRHLGEEGRVLQQPNN
ncbi:MAG TPA: PadR family transcriptional regulator [Jatrophihabitans sp.]|nr:PadR family transcriptional regulator [Jatrophihabitans sp.]